MAQKKHNDRIQTITENNVAVETVYVQVADSKILMAKYEIEETCFYLFTFLEFIEIHF